MRTLRTLATLASATLLAPAAQASMAEYAPWPPPPVVAAQPAREPPARDQPPAVQPAPAAAPADYAAAQSPNVAEPGAPESPTLVPPGQEGSKNLTTAAEAPLHDMNLVRQHIPPILMEALADPYPRPRPLTCAALSAQIERLTVALGPDLDNLPPAKRKGVTESGGLGLQLMNGAAASILPFRGFVGTLSGANKHDALVMRALAAGDAERGYLKGLGEARHCTWPAAPRRNWLPPPPGDDSLFKPDYPIQ